MASDPNPVSQPVHESITAPVDNMLSVGTDSSELPFLVTHWLANYRAGNQITGNRERDEACERLRNAASDVARAFSALGAFGTSRQPAFTSTGVQTTTRNATYSDMARRWQCMPPDHLEALAHAAASVTVGSESATSGLSINLLLAANESQPDASGGRRLADGPQQTSVVPVAMSILQSPSLIGFSSGSNSPVERVSESGERQLSLSVYSDYCRLGNDCAKAMREYLSLREQHQKAENDIKDLQNKIATQEKIKAKDALEGGRSLLSDEEIWNADRLSAQHSQTVAKLEEAQSLRSGELSLAHNLSRSIYSKLSVAMRRYRDPFQRQRFQSIPVPLLSCAPHNHCTLLHTIARQYGNSGRRESVLQKRNPADTSASLTRKALLVNRLSYSMTASAHLSFPIFCLRFDRTGRYFVTGADDALVKLFYIGAAKSNASTQRTFNYGSNDRSAILVCTLRGHAGVICDIDVSYDNAFLATASDDGDCRVWGLKDGTPIAILRGHKDGANMVSWSALTPYRLVTTGSDGFARMWDIREAALNRFGAHVGNRQDYALPSEDIQRRETAEPLSRSNSAGASTNVLESGNMLLPPLPLPEGGAAVVFVPSVSENAGLNIQNVAAGAQQANGNDIQPGQFVFNDLLDQGVRLVSKLQHGAPLDENIPGNATRSRRKAVRVLCIARCPRGGHFVTGADDGLCRVWSDEDGEVIATMDSQYIGDAAQPEQRSSGRRSMRVQQQSEGRLLAEFAGHMNSITDLHYSHAGDRILSASQKDGVARIWSWIESPLDGGGSKFENVKQILLQMKKADTSAIRSYAPSSRRQADGPSASCDVAVWTADDMKIVTSQCCLLKPSSSEIVEGSQYILVWDSQNGQCLLAISSAHSSQVPVLVPHPTIPMILCSGGGDGFVKLWDLEKGECIIMHENNIDFGPVSDSYEPRKYGGYLDGSFSPDGLSLVLTDDNGRFTLFNMVDPDDCGTKLSMNMRKSSSSDQDFRSHAWMKEQYFANDYYELFYASNGYCVEKGSGQPPHLAPRSARCSFTGAPWSEDINDTFSRMVGPGPLPMDTCRRQRDAIRPSGPLLGSGHGALSFVNNTRASLVSCFDPVRTIVIDGKRSSYVSPTGAPAPSGTRVDEPLVGPSRSQGIPSANRRSSSSNGRQLSSNYRWRDYDDILREEARREDEVDLDDDDYSVENDLNLSDSFESEEELDGPRRTRRSTSRSDRAQRRRRSRDHAIALEQRLRAQPTRVSTRQSRRVQPDGYGESDSDGYVEEFLSTNNTPSGPHVEDYTVAGHFFRLPNSCRRVTRRWVRRTENRTSHNGLKSYSPQVGDSVVYIPRAHYETLKEFPTLDAPWKHFPRGTRWPVVRCSVINVRYRFPYEQYYRDGNEDGCRSVVAILALEVTGIPQLSGDHTFPWPKPRFVELPRRGGGGSHTFEVSMFESECPEFIISEKLFTWRLECIENAGFRNRVGFPVVAYYRANEDSDQEMEAFHAKVKSLLPNSRHEPDEHLMDSGYGTMELEWDGGGNSAFSPWENCALSPWEVTLLDKVCHTPSPPCLDEAEIRAIGNALAKIETNPNVNEFFLHPVDERRYPDYPRRVEVAMDFTFIKERLAAGYYCGAESVLADAKLIRDNCIKYNGPSKLSQIASQIYDEFEEEVRAQNLISTSLEAQNGAAFHVDMSRATRHAQRQRQGASTRRSSAEATLLEQLPLPNVQHSEGRPSRQSRLGRNGEPSVFTMAPRRATRSGIAASEVVEEESSEGDRSIAEHDQEYLDGVVEPSEASSCTGRSESECDEVVAPMRRPNARGQRPSRQNVGRRSGRTVKRKNPESSASDYGDSSEGGSLASEGEHLSEVDDESHIPSSRRLTRASATTSHHENPRSSYRRTRAHANSMEDDHSSQEDAESPSPSSRRQTRASTSRCKEIITSSTRTRRHTNSTEGEHLSEEGAESRPTSAQRSTRASTTTSHREGFRTSPRLSRARANSTVETWSSPRHPRSAQPSTSMADVINSEIDCDEDSSEDEDKRNLSQRQKGQGDLSNSRSSRREQGSVPSRVLGRAPRSIKSNGSRGNNRHADSPGEDLSSRRSSRKRATQSMAGVSDSEAADDDALEVERPKEVKKRGSSTRPAGKPSGKRPPKRAKSQRSEPDEGFPQLNSWPEIDLKQITQVTHAVLKQMALLDINKLFVSPVIEQFPDLEESYLSRITTPMDFRTITEDRVQAYQSIQELQADLVLVFRNCATFNPKLTECHACAIMMWEQVNVVFSNVCKELSVLLPRRWEP